jgi:AmmeMemoRadiSam system protein A
MNTKVTQEEKDFLLKLSRRALETFFKTNKKLKKDEVLDKASENLKKEGATFVTLTENGELRGCIGKLHSVQPICSDVIENTYSAALNDFRFEPLTKEELPVVKIEISILTPMEKFEYKDSKELLKMLTEKKPGLYITTSDGYYSATFLPQVWEDLKKPEDFLNELCHKAGLRPLYWLDGHLNVYTYEVIKFSE